MLVYQRVWVLKKNTNINFPSEKDHNQWIWGHTIVRQTNM